MSKVLGVILAGGLATRMGGGDKGRLMLDGQSILDHVINRLGPQVDGLALNANGNSGRFEDLRLPVLCDSIEGYAGPLAGVLAGLDWAVTQGADAIVTAAADTPFFPHDLVAQLQKAGGGQSLALAATREGDKIWRQPTFGLWPVALREDLRVALRDGLRKVVLWTDRHNAGTAIFRTDPFDPFFNVNTPADLTEAQHLACRMAGGE